MKKLFLFLVVVVMNLSSYAQVESPHLTFKGVPIDGKLKDYVYKMEQKGFKNLGIEDGLALLKGDFASYRDCTIGVSTLKDVDLVNKIAVMFPKSDTWSSLSNNYFSLKDMLTEKYGKPAEVIEEFQSVYEPKDDHSKIYEVGMDRCKYISRFETPKGNIQFKISHDGFSSYFVILSYFDKINGEVIREKAIDDL